MRGLRLLVAVVIGISALGMFAVWQRRLAPPLTGDEPDYVVVAESLWFDHDSNLANNFGAHARIAAAVAQPVEPSASIRIDSPTDWRPTQPLGMGVLLAPAIAIGHRGHAELEWARRLMIVLAALLVWQIFQLVADQVALGLAAVITAGVATAFPLVGYSNQLYPEIPAALLFTIGLRGVLASKRPFPILVGSSAAALPWLSMRYLPLSIGLVIALAARREVRGGEVRGGEVRGGAVRQFRPMLIAGGLLALGLAAMIAIDPVSVFHAPSPVPQSAINTYRIGVGGLFSPVFGLLPFAPQLALGVVGLGLVALLRRGAGAGIVIGALVYGFVAIPFGFRGYALPARFQIVLIPLLALGVAVLLRAYPRLLALFAGASLLGLIVLAQAGRQPTYGSLYLDPPRPTFAVLKPVGHVLPDFSLAPGHTGVVVQGSRIDQSAAVPLRRGSYRLTFQAARASITSARVVIDTDTNGVLRPVADVTHPLSPQGMLLVPFEVHRSGVPYRFRVEAPDGSALGAAARSVVVRLTGHGESRTAPSERDLPLGLVWVALTVACAALATRFGRRRIDPPPSDESAGATGARSARPSSA
jgi:hypothetical protein